MSRPVLEVADIFRDHGAAWRRANVGHVSLDQMKVMSAIERCRTAALGGHVARCEDCPHTVIAYNSCRRRHCRMSGHRRQGMARRARSRSAAGAVLSCGGLGDGDRVRRRNRLQASRQVRRLTGDHRLLCGALTERCRRPPRGPVGNSDPHGERRRPLPAASCPHRRQLCRGRRCIARSASSSCARGQPK